MGEVHLCSVCAKANAVVTVLQCDFCGRDQNHVGLLVKGPYGADICDECAEEAVAVVNERRASGSDGSRMGETRSGSIGAADDSAGRQAPAETPPVRNAGEI